MDDYYYYYYYSTSFYDVVLKKIPSGSFRLVLLPLINDTLYPHDTQSSYERVKSKLSVGFQLEREDT